MTGRGGGGGRKTLLAPIHFIFSLLQKRSTVSIWLYENLLTRIEGKIRVCELLEALASSNSSNASAGFRRIHEPGNRRRGRGAISHKRYATKEKAAW